MRSFILGALVVSLVLTACGDDAEVTSATPTTSDDTAASTSEPGTTGEPTTGSSTTDPDATTGPEDTTTDPGAGTAPEDTTDPVTTTDTGDTDPGTTTDGSGGDIDEPYVDCSNDMNDPLPCPDGSMCIDGVATNGAVFGAFCAPACAQPDMACPLPEGSAPELYGMCLFGMGMPTQCALTCFLENDTCPADMQCEDVGLPYGICTHP